MHDNVAKQSSSLTKLIEYHRKRKNKWNMRNPKDNMPDEMKLVVLFENLYV